MTLKLEAPSKTFLVGEYAVLAGGSAIVLNTSPRFSLIATKKSAAGLNGEVADVRDIAQASPAGKWLEHRRPLVKDWNIEFIDPHHGRGGFGASGAQFLMVHSLTTFFQSSVSRAVEGYSTKDLWNDFRTLSNGEGSGADVLAQSVGGAAIVNMEHRMAEGKAWPFADLEFLIVRTQEKIPTHEHLREFNIESVKELIAPAEVCVKAFQAGLADGKSPEVTQRFVESVNTYGIHLQKLGLQVPRTLELLKQIRTVDGVQAAKGCGALGADTILVLVTRSELGQVIEHLQVLGLEVVASADDLSEGLTMNWSWNEV